MNMVYKYPIVRVDTDALVEIEMPQGSRILALQVHVGQEVTGVDIGRGFGPAKVYSSRVTEMPCLWTLVNTEEGKMVRRMFRIYGTGREIKEPLEDLDYIGTVQTGPFVWHVFEEKGMKWKGAK